MIKVIRTQADYEAALADVEQLIELDPVPGSEEADQLELLTLLLKEYETKRFPIELPDPVEAIQFRMEQQDLLPRDLVPYIGTRSRVSEVLARKRELTLPMIRALHTGLGIPAQVLLKEPSEAVDTEDDIDWDRFPRREMIKRGWIPATSGKAQGSAEELLRPFFQPVGLPTMLTALYRRGDHVRSARAMEKYSLAAWTARVMRLALDNPPPAAYRPNTVTLDFMREVAKLSTRDCGPRAAQELLRAHGISLVIEAHLPQTYLDGAAILIKATQPVIGLSVRYDRTDNFWFVLMHELAHVGLHFDQEPRQFYDDLDSGSLGDSREAEADAMAEEALVPDEIWDKSPAKASPSPLATNQLAQRLNIHPAVVAGRIRYKMNAYRLLPQLVGQGEVRRCFPEVRW